MNDALFCRYAELKKQMTALEREIESLQPQVYEELKQLPDPKLKTQYGSFSITRRATWTYSEEIQRIDEDLKAKRKGEQENGTAKAEYTESVTFRAAAAAVA